MQDHANRDQFTTTKTHVVQRSREVLRCLREAVLLLRHANVALTHTAHCRAASWVALSLACGDAVVRGVVGAAETLPNASSLEAVRDVLRPLLLGPADVAAIAEGYAALLAESPAETLRSPYHHGRKQSGSYYTPAPLVECILDEALDSLLSAYADEDALFALRLLDPACGSGHFLLAAFQRLAQRLSQLRSTALADACAEPRLLRCLAGWERDPFAAVACRLRLCVAVNDHVDASELARRCIDVCDSLLDERDDDDPDHQPPAGFDVVVGNPPWISFSGRHAVGEDAETLQRLVARYPAITAWKATHSAFLLRSLELVRPGGRVGLVLPLQMRYHDRYRAVRDAVATQCRAVTVIDAGEDAFDGVHQASGLFHFERAMPNEATLAPSEQWRAARADSPRTTSTTQQHRRRDPLEQVVAQLRQYPPWPKEMFGDPGVHTGNVSRKLIRPADDLQVLAQPEQFAPVREGRDIGPYHCGEAAAKRLWRTPSLETGEYCRIRPLELYCAVPILVRQTASRPIAARHRKPSYFRNSLLACRGHAEVEVEILLAVLNSELMAHYHRSLHGDATQRTFPQVKVRHLRNLPRFDAERLTESRRTRMVELVNEREQQQQQQVNASLDDKIEQEVCALYDIPVSWQEALRRASEENG